MNLQNRKYVVVLMVVAIALIFVIRLFYLQIIKELSLRNWIQYEKDKTNFSYVAELRAKKEYHTFRDLTTAFEIVWYSDALIEARHFEKLSPLFRQFIERLDPLPHVE